MEWAEPTYKIVRFLLLAATTIIIFPYLPGSSSPAFKGISIFLGVLFSLGSTSAVANIVAGIILTYMRAFRLGDRVQIADTVGDVIEISLLVTRIRTIKNVEITIANSMVLSSHFVNFSGSLHEDGLILHTTVTIGYDTPWRQVHELLISAAQATDGIVDHPKPFVLQTALDDFYAHYQINAYTRRASEMSSIYSRMHQNIQDKFYEAGVEIMSPHYSTLRDGNRIAGPAIVTALDSTPLILLIGQVAREMRGREVAVIAGPCSVGSPEMMEAELGANMEEDGRWNEKTPDAHRQVRRAQPLARKLVEDLDAATPSPTPAALPSATPAPTQTPSASTSPAATPLLNAARSTPAADATSSNVPLRRLRKSCAALSSLATNRSTKPSLSKSSAATPVPVVSSRKRLERTPP